MMQQKAQRFFYLFKLTSYGFFSQLAGSLTSLLVTHMVGRSSSLDLSALGAATAFWMPIQALIVGFLGNALPLLTRQRHQDPEGNRKLFWQFFWIATILGGVAWLFFPYTYGWVDYYAPEPEINQRILSYLHHIRWGIPGYCFLTLLKKLNEANFKLFSTALLNFTGLVCETFLSQIFMFGWGFIPLLGVSGCGLASALTHWLMALMALGITFYYRHFYHRQFSKNFFRPCFPDFKAIFQTFRISFFGGLTLFIECLAFNWMALFALKVFGEVAAAAHQIAFQISVFLFLLPSAWATTAMLDWSERFTARPSKVSDLTPYIPIRTTLCIGLFNCFFLLFQYKTIPYYFSNDPTTLALAQKLLLFCAAYQIPDALLVMTNSILRVYQDLPAIALIYFVAYAVVALPLAWILSFFWGAEGLWLSLFMALSFASLLSLGRLKYFLKKQKDQSADLLQDFSSLNR